MFLKICVKYLAPKLNSVECIMTIINSENDLNYGHEPKS